VNIKLTKHCEELTAINSGVKKELETFVTNYNEVEEEV
jgi:hypothetical protein